MSKAPSIKFDFSIHAFMGSEGFYLVSVSIHPVLMKDGSLMGKCFSANHYAALDSRKGSNLLNPLQLANLTEKLANDIADAIAMGGKIVSVGYLDQLPQLHEALIKVLIANNPFHGDIDAAMKLF